MEIADIYQCYRRVKLRNLGRGYKPPKDVDKTLTKLSDQNRAALYKIKDYFNTKWHNISPEMYFECGFEIYKTFTYTMFFNSDILKLYIHRDKAKKLSVELTKKDLVSSAKFVKSFMKKNDINRFVVYCNSRVKGKCLPIIHYLSNDISGYFLTWLMYSRLVNLTENEKGLIPYVLKNYRENIDKLLNVNDFLKMLKEKL